MRTVPDLQDAAGSAPAPSLYLHIRPLWRVISRLQAAYKSCHTRVAPSRFLFTASKRLNTAAITATHRGAWRFFLSCSHCYAIPLQRPCDHRCVRAQETPVEPRLHGARQQRTRRCSAGPNTRGLRDDRAFVAGAFTGVGDFLLPGRQAYWKVNRTGAAGRALKTQGAGRPA